MAVNQAGGSSKGCGFLALGLAIGIALPILGFYGVLSRFGDRVPTPPAVDRVDRTGVDQDGSGSTFP